MAMQTPITDNTVISLIPRCQRGDQAAVEELYTLYADRIYRYLLARVGDGDLAADLTTEVFVRMIGRLAGFRLNAERPAASFSAWLYRVAANLAADHHRGRAVDSCRSAWTRSPPSQPVILARIPSPSAARAPPPWRSDTSPE